MTRTINVPTKRMAQKKHGALVISPKMEAVAPMPASGEGSKAVIADSIPQMTKVPIKKKAKKKAKK